MRFIHAKKSSFLLTASWATGHPSLGTRISEVSAGVFCRAPRHHPSHSARRTRTRDACLEPFPHPRRLFSRDTSRPFDPRLAGPSPARAHPGEACPPATTALTTGRTTHTEEHRHRRHPVHCSPMNCSSSARRSPSRLLPNRSRSRIIRASRCSWAVPSR